MNGTGFPLKNQEVLTMTGMNGQHCHRQGVDGMVKTSGCLGEEKIKQGRRGHNSFVITHRQDLLKEPHAAPPLQPATSFLIFR